MLLNKEQKEEKRGLDLPQADEQAQEQYNRFVLAGVKAVTAASDDLRQLLQTEGDPAQALAQATLTIAPDLYMKAKNVPKDAFYQGSLEIMKNIAEFGKDIIPTDDATMNRAGQFVMEELLDQFGDEQDYAALMGFVGSVDPEEAEKIGSQQEEYANGFNQG